MACLIRWLRWSDKASFKLSLSRLNLNVVTSSPSNIDSLTTIQHQLWSNQHKKWLHQKKNSYKFYSYGKSSIEHKVVKH